MNEMKICWRATVAASAQAKNKLPFFFAVAFFSLYLSVSPFFSFSIIQMSVANIEYLNNIAIEYFQNVPQNPAFQFTSEIDERY